MYFTMIQDGGETSRDRFERMECVRTSLVDGQLGKSRGTNPKIWSRFRGTWRNWGGFTPAFDGIDIAPGFALFSMMAFI
jgi:hypothetical protein